MGRAWGVCNDSGSAVVRIYGTISAQTPPRSDTIAENAPESARYRDRTRSHLDGSSTRLSAAAHHIAARFSPSSSFISPVYPPRSTRLAGIRGYRRPDRIASVRKRECSARNRAPASRTFFRLNPFQIIARHCIADCCVRNENPCPALLGGDGWTHYDARSRPALVDARARCTGGP